MSPSTPIDSLRLRSLSFDLDRFRSIPIDPLRFSSIPFDSGLFCSTLTDSIRFPSIPFDSRRFPSIPAPDNSRGKRTARRRAPSPPAPSPPPSFAHASDSEVSTLAPPLRRRIHPVHRVHPVHTVHPAPPPGATTAGSQAARPQSFPSLAPAGHADVALQKTCQLVSGRVAERTKHLPDPAAMHAPKVGPVPGHPRNHSKKIRPTT